ncbi:MULTISPECIES: DUF3772 domain-containing protein [unclassified Sphingomonas]|uniref:DUF3772 domain-containing protein n=1 Tax=unclassified Sphingomonas TaxID=196159 RepID=UPI00226A62BB|nr:MULTISPECIES: DUF3772 domain-containing protein [unclassified Sphingomonas]
MPIRHLRLLLSLLLLLILPLPLAAQVQPVPMVALSAQLNQADADIKAVDTALDTRIDSDQRRALRARAAAAQGSANDAVAGLEQQLALVDARIAGLGPVAAGVVETADIRLQRSRLAQQRSALDSGAKRGRLLAVEAGQLVTEIDQSQAQQLGQRVSTRVYSPVEPDFWRAVFAAVPRDTRRVMRFVEGGADQARANLKTGRPVLALLGLLAALALLFPVRVAARKAGQKFLIEGAPGHRLRRSANALWRLVIGTLLPWLSGMTLVQTLRWSGMEPPMWSGLLDSLAQAVGLCGFIGALGGALLMRHQPSWRLLPISTETAERMRPWTWLLATLALITVLLDAFNLAIGVSTAMHVLAEVAETLLHCVLAGGVLLTIGRIRAAGAAEADPDNLVVTRAGLTLATLAAWLVLGIALVALLLGYVSLSLFLVRTVTWTAIVAATTYILMIGADDVATSLFLRTSRLGVGLTHGLGLRGSAVDQFGLLLSAVLRLVLVMVAVGLTLSPFGADIGSIFGRMGTLAQGVELGGVSISPGTILRGVIVLFVGLTLVRLFMGWLEGRYLPVTDLDGSARNSVSLVARYVGVLLAGLWALASLGIGMERIALLLSALSVGIGFGLQAITQNFVSGLILLAERPIKIGDLVRVGADEGDVRRISVRSTEIELADHSTLIVPNSELITKSVLNKTLANAMGRVQLQFSVPLGTDPAQVRGIVFEAFAAEPAVLAEPAPKAFIDSIVDGRILFNCFAHVATQRDAYGARSNVLMTLLGRFNEEGVEIGTVAQRLELVGAPLPATATVAAAT